MPFEIVRNDITRVRADAIVNTANPKPTYGRGSDAAIYRAAGAERLLEARRAVGDLAPGQAAHTDAFGLDARYIIHTVGPVWSGGGSGERDTLRACYRNSLELAASLGCASVAFPLIATGVYGFPKDEALHIALSEIGGFLLTHELEVLLVVFDRRALELSQDLMGGISQVIDDASARAIEAAEYGGGDARERRLRRLARERAAARAQDPPGRFDGPALQSPPGRRGNVVRRDAPARPLPDLPDLAGRALDDVVGAPGRTFQQRLFELIDRSGLDDVTVYKRANIKRQVFSSIRCRADYQPKKKTAVAFAIALRLDMPTTVDLLARAGLAFSPSSTFDAIIRYFIDNRNYDIYEINAALFHYGQETLGCSE